MGTREEVSWPRPEGKRAFDLVFTSGGIKRKVIECRTVGPSSASTAAQAFVPERYQRLAKHFHGLKSWAMYQHVAHRLSCDTLQEMLEEFFGLAVCQQELHMFKSLMARYYQAMLPRGCSTRSSPGRSSTSTRPR